MMIPVSEPFELKKSKKYLLDCIASGWVSSQGPYIQKFEDKFADFLGVKYAVTTTSGTTAIHLALASIDLKPKDEVIVPTFTMLSSVTPILYLNARPVFVDCTPDSWTMDVGKVEKKITSKTKAIIAVHIYGHPADMDPLIKLAKKYHLYLIEDAAESLGSRYKNRKTGSIGDLSCFSFYANKLITTGEGGIVATNDSRLAGRLRLLKDMAHSSTQRFLHEELGYNYRFTNLQAALGYSQILTIQKRIRLKKQMAGLYVKYLKNIKALTLPVELPWASSTYWMYGILVNPVYGITRNQLADKLRRYGIDTRNFFIPMHRQPVLKKMGLVPRESFPVSDDISQRGLYLPSAIGIKKETIKKICQKIQLIYEKM